MNVWVALGRLTDDVEIRYSTNENHTAVGSFSLAVDDGYGERKKTSFFRCTIFGARAEALQKYTRKGAKIAVKGHPEQEEWTDKEGRKRRDVRFIVDEWDFAQAAAEKPATGANNAPQDDFTSIPDGISDEELPFN